MNKPEQNINYIQTPSFPAIIIDEYTSLKELLFNFGKLGCIHPSSAFGHPYLECQRWDTHDH